MFCIYADGQLVCSSSVLSEDKYMIGINASLENALQNKAGSFNFQLLPCHYLYNSLKKYKTVISVWLDEDCIFIGRIMNFTTTQEGKEIYCEGCLSYFNDSVQYKFERKTTTPRQRLAEIVEQHNSQVDVYKRFRVGIVNVLDADILYEFEATAPQDSFSAITGDLTDRFGGYLHVTEESNVLVLDWLRSYEHLCLQPITFGQNLIQYSENDSESDIWSILYPTASGAEDQDFYIGSVNGGSNFYEIPERIRTYGRIIKSLTFSDVESDAELLEETKKWVEKHTEEVEPTITIDVVDLSSIFSDYESFSIGDTIVFRLTKDSPLRSLICSKISYNLFKPGIVQLTLGLEPVSLTDVYFADKQENDDRYQDTQDHFQTTDAQVEQNRRTGASNSAGLAQAQKDIVVNAESITANAELIQMNADRIEANAKSLDLKASSADLVWVDKKHSEHFEKVDGEINSLNEDTARLATRMRRAEIEINGEEGYIGLKGTTAQLYGDVRDINGNVEAMQKELDEQGEYINSVDVKIDSANAQIALKASQEYVDEFGRQLSEALIAIDGINSTILLKADKIDLQGYVTASQLEAVNARIDDLFSGDAELSSANIGTLRIATAMTYDDHIVGWHSAEVVTKVGVTANTKTYSNLVTSVGWDRETGKVTSVGNAPNETLVRSVSVNPEFQTIYYLGSYTAP